MFVCDHGCTVVPVTFLIGKWWAQLLGPIWRSLRVFLFAWPKDSTHLMKSCVDVFGMRQAYFIGVRHWLDLLDSSPDSHPEKKGVVLQASLGGHPIQQWQFQKNSALNCRMPTNRNHDWILSKTMLEIWKIPGKKNSMHFMKLRSLPPENVQHHQKERIEKRPTIIFRGEIREDWGNLAEKCLCGGSAGCKQGHGSMDTCTTDELLGIPGEQKRWVDQWKNGKGAMCEFERLWL